MIWHKKYPLFSKFCPFSINTHPNRSSKTWPSRKKLPKSARRAPCSNDIRSTIKWSVRWTTSRQPWRIWHRGSRCCSGIFPRGKKKPGKNTRKNRGRQMRGVNSWKKRLSNWNMVWIVISGCCWRARFRRKREVKMKSKKMWTWLRNKCKMKTKRCWAPRRWHSATSKPQTQSEWLKSFQSAKTHEKVKLRWKVTAKFVTVITQKNQVTKIRAKSNN